MAKLRWLICFLLVMVWLSAAAQAAATEEIPADIRIVRVPTVTQSQKEVWLLDAITRGDRTLAWQIAGRSFQVAVGTTTYSVDGLNIDLAYRGRDDRPLIQAIKQRAGHYRANPTALHRDLSDPNRVVHQLASPPTADICIPGSMDRYELLITQGIEYHLINGKLYHLEMGLYHGVPQDLLVYNASATRTYQTNPLAFQFIGNFSVD